MFTLVSSHVGVARCGRVFFLASRVYVLVHVPATLLVENFRTMLAPSVTADPMLCSWLWGAPSCLFDGAIDLACPEVLEGIKVDCTETQSTFPRSTTASRAQLI